MQGQTNNKQTKKDTKDTGHILPDKVVNFRIAYDKGVSFQMAFNSNETRSEWQMGANETI